MKYLFILVGLIVLTSSITVTPNGNSPEIKMISGMMIDAQKGLNPVIEETTVKNKSNYEKSRTNNFNNTKLSINERYRRLIPYMTFYYANDLVSPTTVPYSTENVEIQKVNLEQNTVPLRTGKKINIPYRPIPRYQGNRLTQYNIASANPTKATHYLNPAKGTPNQNPYYMEQSFMNGHTFGRNTVKQKPISHGSVFEQSLQYQTQKPYHDLFHADDPSNIQYYIPENKERAVKYKLVPYEQTPPVQFISHHQAQNYYDQPKNPIPVPVLTTGSVYKSKPRPQSQIMYEDIIIQPPANRVHNYPVTKMYYERTPKPITYDFSRQPLVPESGFRPMLAISTQTHTNTADTISYAHSTTPAPPSRLVQGAPSHQKIQAASQDPEYRPTYNQPEYYDYVAQGPSLPTQDEQTKYSSRDSATLSEILLTLQNSNSIPQPITKENVGSSIRTLLQVLSALKATSPQHNEVETSILSTPRPLVASPKIIIDDNAKPEVQVQPSVSSAGLGEEEYLAPVNVPSQHLDDYRGSSQAFPLVIASEDDGGTPGRAGIDYPTLTTIPHTTFDCKAQRYKGFFADPDTKCQVWHYCDLNGGQASFLCPNGTIFSQAALTCDWWFNVQCDSTHQLYVLNERLYKYILPHTPKFPEDYSGPLVDKYLTIKFKEMEEQFKKNKKKSSGSSEAENEGEGSENEKDEGTEANSRMGTVEENGAPAQNEAGGLSSVSETSVVVESPGNSGAVQHLEE